MSVVVPTYRRPDHLRACLRGLVAQGRTADEVVVVRRPDDDAAGAVRREYAGTVREVLVDRPGVVAALSAGLRASTGEVVAFTDDDAIPRPDWLARIVTHFGDPALGVLGGRDVLPADDPGDPGDSRDVGRITPWGKLVGNHHVGRGDCRDVDVVKGVNLAVRRCAAALPVGLRGRGAQPHWEVPLCLWARARGWRVVYDPHLLVDHYPTARPAGDRRGSVVPADVAAEAYNLVAGQLSQRPHLFWRRAAFGLTVGDAAVPGLARAAYGFVRGDRDPARRLCPSLAGQLAALRDVRRPGVALRVVPVGPTAPEEPVRVTLVAHDVHDQGGMERALTELVRRAGPQVAFTVVSASLAPDLRQRVVRWLRVPVPRRPFPLRFAAFAVLAGMRLRRYAGPAGHLVHTCGAIVPNRVDVATVHLCHAGLAASTRRGGPPSADVSRLRRLNTALARVLSLIAERWTYGRPRVRVLAVVSPDVGREVVRYGAAVPVVVTRNGVDSPRFAPHAPTRTRVRAAFELTDHDCVALFVGGDWSRKGLPMAIDALARTVADGAPVRLWVVGPGNEARYRAHAERAGVGDRITFFGRRADTETFYRAADVFVLPSAYEAFSLALLEAAAAGLPVVVTPVNGAVDVVGHDEAGLLVDRTPESVASALARLAGDPALRRRLGAQGRRRVSGWTWDANVDRVVELYRDLLPHRDLRPRGPTRAEVSHGR